jgi:hypothetical protein
LAQSGTKLSQYETIGGFSHPVADNFHLAEPANNDGLGANMDWRA